MLRTDFKTKFLNQLNNVEMPLEERLHMVYGALISQAFPLPGKEQIIINWFAHCLKVNSNRPKGVLKKLVKCLNSDWLLTFSDAIDASKLIEVFLELDEGSKHRYSKLLVKCVLSLLKLPGFQRYCRFDILPMTEAVLLACELMSDTAASGERLDDSSAFENTEDELSVGLEDLFNSIINIYKVTQQRNELQLRLVKFILPALFKLNVNIKESIKFHNLLEEIIIGDDTEAFCNAFKYSTSRNIPDHLKALVKYITEHNTSDVVILNSVIFDVYVHTCVKVAGAETNHLTLFYILTSIAGFKLELPYDVPSGCSDRSSNLPVLTELVAVLQKYNISASSESEEGELSNFLIFILKKIISEEYQLSADLLQTVYGIFQVYPESVRTVFLEFSKYFIFVKKENAKILSVYDTLMQEVCKIFADLSQLGKFLSSFFHKAFLLSKEHDFTNLTSEEVLSSGFFKVLTEKLPSLTGNQLKTIIGRLEKIFLNDCVLTRENESSTDGNFCLVVDMMVKVVCHVLEHACIVLPTRWSMLSAELNQLIQSVQRFGVACLKSSESVFLLCFLRLVGIMADIEIIMNQYVISLASTKILPKVKSKDKAGSVNNLAKSHGFLAPPDWKHISELVMESYDQRLKHCWYNLLLQKYLRLGDTDVVTHLVLTADSEWLWRTVRQLSSCVPQKYMELYTEQLVSVDCLSADILAALGNAGVLKNRAFRVAMSFQTLKCISKLIPDKSTLSKNMMKLIDMYSVIKHESDSSSATAVVQTMSNAVAEVMNKCPWDDQPIVLEEEVKEHLTRLLDLLTVMRPYGLKIDTKQIIFLILVGITYDLRSEDGLLHSILEIILGCLDDSRSPVADSLDRRVFMSWLVTVVPPGYTARRQLVQLSVHKVISTLDRCVDDMTGVVQSDTDLLCAMLDTLTQVHGSKSLKNKEFSNLVKQLISIVSLICLRKPKAKFLKLYTAALKAEYTYFKDKAPSLLQNLPVYLEILFQKLAEQSLLESDATELINFILTTNTGIDSGIMENVNKVLTEELCKVDPCSILCYPLTVKSFLEYLSPESFDKLLNEIYKNQNESLTSDEGQNMVSSVCAKWNVILSAQLDKDRSKLLLRHKMLTRVLSDCQPHLEQNPAGVQSVVLQLLHSVCVCKSVVLASKLVDHILVIVGLTPTDSETHLLPDALAVLGALLHFHSELVYDRIPPFLQRFRAFVRSLVQLAAADSASSVAYNSITTESVNQVTRIIKSITDQHSKHFARIAPYLVADLMQLLVTHTIQSSVKNELQNCVCSLLSLCDHYGTQLLQNLLPPGATELFKVVRSNFRHSYKYTGKV